MRFIPILLSALLLSTPALAAEETIGTDLSHTPAGAYTLDKSHASITYRISHLGFSNYTGRFNTIDATLDFNPAAPEKSTVKATITTSSVDSHDSTLEAILIDKQFFNSKQFPTATFESTRIEKTDATHGKIHGNFTLLGITKPIVLDATFNAAGPTPMIHTYRLGFSATTRIKRSDFGINAYLPMLGDDVTLTIETEFEKK